jgi:hypothetical protein
MDKNKKLYFMERWWLTGYLFAIGLTATQPAMSSPSLAAILVLELFAWPVFVGAVIGRLIAQITIL